MIPFPEEWVRHHGENMVTAQAPDGARYRYRERVRPAPDFATIVEQTLAGDPAFAVSLVGETVRLVTAEGEYGASVGVEGIRGGQRARRAIGAVFTEDFACTLDALVTEPSGAFGELERRARGLLGGVTLQLGVRPRLYFYVPPDGWQSLPNGLVASWYPDDFPANHANIVVPPATPTTVPPADAVDELMASAGSGLDVDERQEDAFTSDAGTIGAYARLLGTSRAKGEPVYREVAGFSVPPYVYTMRLESAAGGRLPELSSIFRALAGSFWPLPNIDERRSGLAFVRPTLFDHRAG